MLIRRRHPRSLPPPTRSVSLPEAAPSPERRQMSGRVSGLTTGLALALALISGPALAGTLEVTVENVKSTAGQMRIAVYNSAESYQKKPFWMAQIPVTSPVTRFTIPDLAAGQYAVTLFQDRNEDGKVDANLFGVPTEPCGFSNNPRNLMGPASWEQTRIDYNGAAMTLAIRLTD